MKTRAEKAEPSFILDNWVHRFKTGNQIKVMDDLIKTLTKIDDANLRRAILVGLGIRLNKEGTKDWEKEQKQILLLVILKIAEKKREIKKRREFIRKKLMFLLRPLIVAISIGEAVCITPASTGLDEDEKIAELQEEIKNIYIRFLCKYIKEHPEEMPTAPNGEPITLGIFDSDACK